ncbi:hypothetical protein pdul_cds_268 [Pandoravirus dulcis]|uniref:Uncharacterized protein n=1 Tax=Pandoravirus dulcis TaxID=1349409 RepID=S4VS52_9VIRU|nr:hypothetical protein pdul_cds_268 [Pandoravirus dulcis]AGO82240.1 hypothetical protein pdul_cds_268 [Pandoravirus dulcis]
MEATDGTRDSGAPTAHALDDRRPTDADMIEQALSCVAWDESVDLERLLVLEHAYNRTVLTGAVAVAARRLDRDRDGRALSVYSLGTKGTTERDHTDARRLQAAWSVGDSNGSVAITLTDTEFVDYLAVCARHVDFSVYYWIRRGDEGFTPDTTPHHDPTEKPNYAHTWVARLVAALARQTGAWTGIDIMRTHNLCAALIKILDARMHDGPLASVDVSKCAAPLDQSAVPKGVAGLTVPRARDALCTDAARQDMAAEPACPCAAVKSDAAHTDDVLESMRRGLAQVALLRRRGMDFNAFVDGACFSHTQPFLRAYDVLGALRCSTERLYATESYFCKMIAPAEYKAMAEDAPFGSTFYR